MSLQSHKSGIPPIVWTIAGSDTCGGAGIQADLKTFTAFGVHGASIVTAITAQNSFAVTVVEPVASTMLEAQFAALDADMLPRAIKIGLLPSISAIRETGHYLARHPSYIVCDPVIEATSGTTLIQEDVVPAIKELLFPHVDILTPNIHEAEILLGKTIHSALDVETAARDIRVLGARSVIIKGWREADFAQDFYLSENQSFWLTAPWREDGEARGTGCTFAATLAAAHALGLPEYDAVVVAKAYVTQALRLMQPVGKGAAILGYTSWPAQPQDMPWLTASAEEGRNRPHFPDCGPQKLGFYPILDSVSWLKRLLPLGVSTVQLRIKNLYGALLEAEIKESISLAKHYNCRLFINDYWEIALRQGAYGVHLGQEDLEDADITTLRASGIRLGISTHCYSEIARAIALRPSYIAIGPVFPTTLKIMNFSPHGIDNFSIMRRLIDCPVVAIGGIKRENAEALLAAGADSIAVVSDVTKNVQPETHARKWLNVFSMKPHQLEQRVI